MRARQKDRDRHVEKDGKRPEIHDTLAWSWCEENDCVFFTGFCFERLTAEISDW